MPDSFTLHGPYYLEKADARVNYRVASMDTEKRCGMCRFYSMNGCRLVEGVIEADHVSDLFSPLPVMEPGEENISNYWYTDSDERPKPPETSPLADKFRLFMEKRFIDAPAQIPCLPKPGIYYHPYYGEIHITTERNQHFIDNVAAKVYQPEIPIDAEHETKVSGALGWIQSLVMNEDGSVDAVISWTDRGVKMLAEDRFKYVSPEWYDVWTDPATQVEYTDVLVGAALCTRPFFKHDSLRPLAATERGMFILGKDGAFTPVSLKEPEMTKANDAPADKNEPVVEPNTDPQVAIAAGATTPPGTLQIPQDFNEVTRRLTEMEASNAALRATVETTTSALTQATEQLKSMAGDARRKRFKDEVLGISDVNKVRWFGDPDKHVSTLEMLAEKLGEDSEQFKDYITQQRAVGAQVQSSSLFRESGTGVAGTSGDGQDSIETMINAKMAADPKLGYTAAMDLVFKENPSLHQQHSDRVALRVSGNK